MDVNNKYHANATEPKNKLKELQKWMSKFIIIFLPQIFKKKNTEIILEMDFYNFKNETSKRSIILCSQCYQCSRNY